MKLLNLTGTHGARWMELICIFVSRFSLIRARCPQEKFITAEWYGQSSHRPEPSREIFYGIGGALFQWYWRQYILDWTRVIYYDLQQYDTSDTVTSKPIMKNYLPVLIGKFLYNILRLKLGQYLEDFATFWQIFL